MRADENTLDFDGKQKNAVALTLICLQYDTVLLSCFQRRTGMERSSTGDINTQSDRPDWVPLCVWHTLIDSHTHTSQRGWHNRNTAPLPYYSNRMQFLKNITESKGNLGEGGLSRLLQTQKLHFFLGLVLIICPSVCLLCALIPSPSSPCMSNPCLDDRWYQRRPPVTPPDDKIKSKWIWRSSRKKWVRCVFFLIPQGGFVLQSAT